MTKSIIDIETRKKERATHDTDVSMTCSLYSTLYCRTLLFRVHSNPVCPHPDRPQQELYQQVNAKSALQSFLLIGTLNIVNSLKWELSNWPSCLADKAAALLPAVAKRESCHPIQ